MGQGRGWEGQRALKGKLLKPLGQEVAERGCFLWQSRGVVRAGPTSCLSLWALGGRGELRALLSQSLPLQEKKMETLSPPDWRGALSEEVIFLLQGEEF